MQTPARHRHWRPAKGGAGSAGIPAHDPGRRSRHLSADPVRAQVRRVVRRAGRAARTCTSSRRPGRRPRDVRGCSRRWWWRPGCRRCARSSGTADQRRQGAAVVGRADRADRDRRRPLGSGRAHQVRRPGHGGDLHHAGDPDLLHPAADGRATLAVARSSGVPLTVFVVVATINAVNFIDGLDGLAAGVAGIAALALFSYAYLLSKSQGLTTLTAATLIAAILFGCAASCRTTSAWPRSSWATPARCRSGCCSAPPRSC